MVSGNCIIETCRQFCCLVLFFLASHGINAQTLFIEWVGDSLPYATDEGFSEIDSVKVLSELENALEKIRQEGYWSAGIDTLVRKSDTLYPVLHLGPRFEKAQISLSPSVEEPLRSLKIKKSWIADTISSFTTWLSLREQLLISFEENGFPFAVVSLRDVAIVGHEISGVAVLEKGPFLVFGPIQTVGNARISKNFLAQYTGLKEGTPYKESLVRTAPAKLNKLPFLQQKKPVKMFFVGKEARPNVLLDRVSSNKLDFVLGLLPANSSAPNEERQTLLLTGYLNARFLNPFGGGEELILSFEQLRPQQQKLLVGFSYPYALNTSFGFDGNFRLFRRDSAFVEIQSELGVRWLRGANEYVKVAWKTHGTNLVAIDEETIRAQKRLPPDLDIRNSLFHLDYSFRNVDDLLVPSDGWQVLVGGSVGRKKIIPNNRITSLQDTVSDFNFTSLYDSLELSNSAYRAQLDLAYFFPLNKLIVIKGGLVFGGMWSNGAIYRSEQFRIGGNKILRGFDEESVLANVFGVLTAEVRLKLNRRSFWGLFVDRAYIENIRPDLRIYDRPIGFGSGIQFETTAGIFGLSIAFGSQLGQPVDWAAPKVHFGYVSLF